MDVKVLGATCDGSFVIGVLRFWFSMFSWQYLHKGALFKGKNDSKFVMKKLRKSCYSYKALQYRLWFEG